MRWVQWWSLWFLLQIHEGTATVTSDEIVYQQRVRVLDHARAIGKVWPSDSGDTSPMHRISGHRAGGQVIGRSRMRSRLGLSDTTAPASRALSRPPRLSRRRLA